MDGDGAAKNNGDMVGVGGVVDVGGEGGVGLTVALVVRTV
jgi:hypothetical protein